MSKDQPSTWSEWVAHQVRAVRKSRGWSVKELADRCAEVGAPELTSSALYVLEGPRRRNVTIEQIAALALALDVPPLILMLPKENVDYPITPTVSARASTVAKWLMGLSALQRRVPDPDNPGEFLLQHPGDLWERQRQYSAELTRSLPYVPPVVPGRLWEIDEVKAIVDALRSLDDEKLREVENLLMGFTATSDQEHSGDGGTDHGEH